MYIFYVCLSLLVSPAGGGRGGALSSFSELLETIAALKNNVSLVETRLAVCKIPVCQCFTAFSNLSMGNIAM